MPDLMQNETNVESVKILSVKEIEKLQRNGMLSSYIRTKFTESADHRKDTENKWLDAYRAWRGEYSPEETAKLQLLESKVPGSSKVFIKITKTKVQAAIGQIYEVLFAGNEFPMGIEATKKPEGIEETATLENPDSPMPKLDTDVYGYNGDGKELPKGADTSLMAYLKDKLGSIATKLSAKGGKSPDRNMIPEVYPAMEAARCAEKTIKDQLNESHAEFALRKSVFDQVCFGTGILKGPVGYDRVKHNYQVNEEGGGVIYTPETKFSPKVEYVSCWDFYPDPTAMRVEDCDFVIQRHLFNKKQLRDLKANSTFDKDAINGLLAQGPSSYATEGWESIIKDDQKDATISKYEVLEFWGFIDSDLAKQFGLKVPKNKDIDIQVNVWECNGEIIRVILNPFEPRRTPYFAFPYEEHPHQIWGIGVPENMKDTQALMNGHYRMAIDNLRLSGSVIFEVDESTLKPGQDMTIYPGKIFRKQGGAPGQSIFSTKFQDVSTSHMQMFDRARQLSDESTGIPSYSHGQMGVNSTTRTAAGMSMLMNAASLNIKTVVKNIDQYLIKPLGESMYRWNMQFNDYDLEIRGDLEIVAKGTSSLMQKEVQSQRLISFMQIMASNPFTGPLANYKYIAGEIAKSLDLDPDKAINDADIAKLYAEMLQLQQGGGANANGIQGGSPASGIGGEEGGGSYQASGGNVGEAGITGNGNGTIGTGNVPMPGQTEYSGNAPRPPR